MDKNNIDTYHVLIRLVKVIISTGQAKAALIELNYISGAVSFIGADSPREEAATVVLIVIDLERTLQVPTFGLE